MKQIFEILKDFENVKKEDRKQFLLDNRSQALETVLFFNFEPSVKFAHNDILKLYNPQDFQPGTGITNLHKECRKFHYFLKDHPMLIKDERKAKATLLGLLESLENEEASVVIKMMQKGLRAKGLTYLLVRETFPDMPWSNK